MGFSYIIEHMEKDEPVDPTTGVPAGKALPRWVELEYTHMLTFAGPASTVLFTHLSPSASSSLSATLAPNPTSASPPRAKAECHTAGILDLLKERGIPLEKVCLLDPKAESELSPEDGDGRFSCFLFGGILGDDPPRDRTAELRVLGFPARRLGPVQMTTDTALGVSKIVVEDGVPLEKIPYTDHPTITFNAHESVEMPFRYIADAKGEPRLPPGMREHLHEDLNQSFEF
ncbi:DUF431-domain-containing protein [Dentipellis sp. KUC8613]|nr:DUF431-domain-containing protein [Dentipellis sp. KUC8613]